MVTVRDGNDNYRWFALLAVLAGLFSTGITITILGNSLGTIAKDIGTIPATATWVLTGQLLTQAVLMPLMGKLGDLHGHRKVFLIGLAVFVLMAIPTALAPNVGLLIAFRALGVSNRLFNVVRADLAQSLDAMVRFVSEVAAYGARLKLLSAKVFSKQ